MAQPDVVVDTRPLWQLLLSRGRRPFLLAGGVGLFWAVSAMPQPEGLSPEGQSALAVFALCVFYWVTGALPLMITGLLAIVLIPLSGVMQASQAYALFGNEAIFFILGAFILAAAMMRSGLSTRMAILMLDRFRGTPRRLLLTVLLLNAGMSCVMSEHAVAAMTFPIIVEVASVLRINPHRSTYGRALFISMAWGSTIGGVMTLLGGARGPLAIAILRESAGETFSFREWTEATWPIVLTMLAFASVIIPRFFPIDVDDVAAADQALAEKRLALGRISYRERAIAAVMLVTLGVWVWGGEALGLAVIALSAVIALFALQLVTWRDVEDYVNWGIILMYGGAICLGAAVSKSGAAAWLAHHTISTWATEPWTVIMLFSLLSVILTEAISNTAVVALLLPVGLGVAGEYGIDARVMALSIAVPAGFAFTLPIGTPANAIAYSSGFFRLRHLIGPGILLNLVGWAGFNVMAWLYWPLIGLRIP